MPTYFTLYKNGCVSLTVTKARWINWPLFSEKQDKRIVTCMLVNMHVYLFAFFLFLSIFSCWEDSDELTKLFTELFEVCYHVAGTALISWHFMNFEFKNDHYMPRCHDNNSCSEFFFWFTVMNWPVCGIYVLTTWRLVKRTTGEFQRQLPENAARKWWETAKSAR